MEIAKWDGKPVPSDHRGLLDIPEAEYHKDPGEKPTLSQSIAKKIVAESPLHGWIYHPRFGGLSNKATKAMGRGKIIHSLILDTGTEDVVLLEYDNYKKKAAQEARDSAVEEGRTPILAHEYREAEAVAEEVKDALRKEGVHLSGASEVAGFWQETVGDEKVSCRCRYDHVIPFEGTVWDIKTTTDANPEFLSRQIVEFGYDIQWAAYTSSLGKIMDLEGRIDFAWIFIEELPEGSPKKAIVQIMRPGAIMRELGRCRWENALKTWAECLRSDYWPAYVVGPSLIDPPEWAAKRHLAR